MSATRLSPPIKSGCNAAARQRRHRERERRGGAVLRVEVADYYAMIEALIAAGFVTEAAALDRKNVEAAVAELVTTWASEWQGAR